MKKSNCFPLELIPTLVKAGDYTEIEREREGVYRMGGGNILCMEMGKGEDLKHFPDAKVVPTSGRVENEKEREEREVLKAKEGFLRIFNVLENLRSGGECHALS